ncbi:MAG: ABC transporter permease [Acetobacteraceae bacterium]
MRLRLPLWQPVVAAVFVFLPAPIVIVIAASFSHTGYLDLPPWPLSLRWYIALLSDTEWLGAIGTSLALAFVAASASVLTALCAAQVLARRRFTGSHFIGLLLMLPLVFPHAALAVVMVGLLMSFGAGGTFAGLLLVHAILTLPYAYRPLIGSVMSLDTDMEEAAMSLGARPFYVLRRVSLPLIRPGLITGFLFAFIVSFDEVTVTMFLTGPDITTLPVKIFHAIQETSDPVVGAVSSLIVLVTILAVMLVQRVVRLEQFAGHGGSDTAVPARRSHA